MVEVTVVDDRGIERCRVLHHNPESPLRDRTNRLKGLNQNGWRNVDVEVLARTAIAVDPVASPPQGSHLENIEIILRMRE